MEVIAYDPYVRRAAGRRSSASAWSAWASCWRESDFISVHLPKNAETTGLIGPSELAKVKPGVRIINAARGGIVTRRR